MKSRSTTLAYLLRHDDSYNFPLEGWRTIDDKSCVRALYGHSVDVFPDLVVCPPPEVLYHGTSLRVLDKIMQEGIQKMSRNKVHLTTSKMDAKEVGARHGPPIILKINVLKMKEAGVCFLKARNGTIWMTDYVAPLYVSILDE